MLFLAGDVMTGRGVDQILPHSGVRICTSRARSQPARYVELAEAGQRRDPAAGGPRVAVGGCAASSPSRARRPHRQPGDQRHRPRTTSRPPRTSTTGCTRPTCRLTAARLDVCVLANNHVLDFGRRRARRDPRGAAARGICDRRARAGRPQAWRPAALDAGGRRGAARLAWARPPAASRPAGRRPRTGPASASSANSPTPPPRRSAAALRRARRPGTWRSSPSTGVQLGLRGPASDSRFAHGLIDDGVDLVHGHSSHHPRPHRGLPRPAHPLRLRRPHQRLRGHRRPRAVPRRPPAAVPRAPGLRQRPVGRAAHGTDAGPAAALAAGH